MVGKKAPVKRLTVAKSASAPRSKKLNLDKLLISIKKISTRYNKNGKMTGGAPNPVIEKAMNEIKKFFNKNNAKIAGSDTSLYKTLVDIDKIILDTNETKKNDLLETIKDLTGNDTNSLSKYIQEAKNLSHKDKTADDRIGFFTIAYETELLNITKGTTTQESKISQALAYIYIFKLASTLTNMYNELNRYNSL